MLIPRAEQESQRIIHDLSQKYFGVDNILAKVGMSERDLSELYRALLLHHSEIELFVKNYAQFPFHSSQNLEERVLKILRRNDIFTIQDLKDAIDSGRLDRMRGIGKENKKILCEAYEDYWILSMDPDTKGA